MYELVSINPESNIIPKDNFSTIFTLGIVETKI